MCLVSHVSKSSQSQSPFSLKLANIYGGQGFSKNLPEVDPEYMLGSLHSNVLERLEMVCPGITILPQTRRQSC